MAVKTHTLLTLGALVVACLSLVALAGATPAFAEAPWWDLSYSSLPTNLPPGGEGKITVLAVNLGNGSATSPVVLTDRLPAGLEAQSVVALEIPGAPPALVAALGKFLCTVIPQEVKCEIPPLIEPVPAYGHIEAEIAVKVASAAKSGEENKVSISGGEAPSVSIGRPITVSSEPTPFGVEQYQLRPENADGSPDTQAGSHPFQLTTVINLKQTAKPAKPPAAIKDLHFNLPPGLIGNPTPFPQCPLAKFTAIVSEGANLCPDNTVVGVSSVTLSLGGEPATAAVPLFALTPSVGEPARFGFDVAGVPVYLDTAVRSGGDYGVTVNVDNISELAAMSSTRVTFWGVPGDPSHDPSRGWNCLDPIENSPPCGALGETTPPPLIMLPTACTGPVHTNVEADSWEQPEVVLAPFEYTFQDSMGRPVGMDGCNRVPFTPEVKVTPDEQAGSTPTGLTVDEHVPQESDLNPTALGESAVKGLSVTLPEGVVLNPAGADGLQACSQAQIGLESDEVPGCPEASKIATVKVKTPLLPEALEGAAYLAAQDSNPFGSLVAVYIYAEDPTAGVRVKAAGEVLENPVTGQLTAHFEGDPVFQGDPRFADEPEAQFLPELPWEDVELHFFGGDRAPLGTPALCGSYTTTGMFTPWSENPVTESSSEFKIISGPNGSPCESPLPFAPSLTAGMTSIQAGGFSPFSMTMSREDGNQDLRGVQLKMPPGLLGTLSTVKLCGESQADAGTCGPESLIGETVVSVGLGGDPYSVTGGKVYITGPYDGAPYGLSIVNPAKAGPFDLGIVVVRAKVEVDPITAALTITTDGSGPYAIPRILDGIPLQIKHVNVTIDRAGFTFNPTNCEKTQIGGSLTSTQGASSTLAVPFQVTNCAVLAFKPKLTASTSGKSSRKNGTSLALKIAYPKNAMGGEAWFKSAKFDFPKQLPARLTTLQKACPAAKFDANPASCPAESHAGTALVSTPVLPDKLTGVVYFVSYGDAKFPEAVIVLQGDGVTVDLHAETFIDSKTGVTSATLRSIPGVPFNSVEVTLPSGPYSEFAANGDLCASTLKMPIAFTAQNGLAIHQNTPVNVTGCPKHVRHERRKPHKKKRK